MSAMERKYPGPFFSCKENVTPHYFLMNIAILNYNLCHVHTHARTSVPESMP